MADGAIRHVYIHIYVYYILYTFISYRTGSNWFTLNCVCLARSPMRRSCNWDGLFCIFTAVGGVDNEIQ